MMGIHRFLRTMVPLAVLVLSACGGGSGTGTGTGTGNSSGDNGSSTNDNTGTTDTNTGTTTASYTIGGTVSGLNGTLVLQNSGGDNLSLGANGAFTFATAVTEGGAYSITILSQPAGQRCNVTSGNGIASSNITNVNVACAANLMGGSVQGRALALSGTVSTVASSSLYKDGIGTAAHFRYLRRSVSDGTNLYVVDSGNLVIRKIVIATGEVTTLAGRVGVQGNSDGIGAAATFWAPAGIAIDSTHTNLYVTDGGSSGIRRIVIATGQVTSVVNPGTQVNGIVVDPTNDNVLYLVAGGFIKKVDIAAATVTTLAGIGQGYQDGPGLGLAMFYMPVDLAIDSTGTNLYVADMLNHRIRQIAIATGNVTTLAGSGLSWTPFGLRDGVGTAADIAMPRTIAIDASDANLYVVDSKNNIRKIAIATADVTTLAPQNPINASDLKVAGNALWATDNASLSRVVSVALSDGAITTLAGPTASTLDGVGTNATFYWPYDVTTDGANLYVADQSNNTIRKMVIATGEVTTLAGTAGVTGSADGIGAAASFDTPTGITTDGANLYVADQFNYTIRKIVIATGEVTTLAGTAGVTGSADGIGTNAKFGWIAGITTDGANLYAVDQGNNTIRKIVIATGEVTTLAGTVGVAGSADGIGAAASFDSPSGITTDGVNLYVADSGNNKIRKVVIATGEVSSFTGTANTSETTGANDGAAATAQFNYPNGITTDGVNLYVADELNFKIRQIVIATGEVSSVTGAANTSEVATVTDGPAASARFSDPISITTDGTSLYVVDLGGNTLRKIQ